MAKTAPPIGRMVQAGILSWILPGAGHFALGHRGLGLIFFIAVTFPFATGLAVGGVKNMVNPWGNRWLFLAELGTGGYTTAALMLNKSVGFPPEALADPEYIHKIPKDELRRYLSFYPESDVALIYLATAGLLNILVILDALTRAQTGGLPTFYRELGVTPGDSEAPGGDRQ